MSKDYNKMISKLEDEIEELQIELNNDRINLEEQFDDQSRHINELLEKNTEEHNKFKTIVPDVIKAAEKIYNSPDALDPSEYRYSAGDFHSKYEEYEKKFIENDNKLNEAMSELKGEYDRLDDSLQKKFQIKTNEINSQMDELIEERDAT